MKFLLLCTIVCISSVRAQMAVPQFLDCGVCMARQVKGQAPGAECVTKATGKAGADCKEKCDALSPPEVGRLAKATCAGEESDYTELQMDMKPCHNCLDKHNKGTLEECTASREKECGETCSSSLGRFGTFHIKKGHYCEAATDKEDADCYLELQYQLFLALTDIRAGTKINCAKEKKHYTEKCGDRYKLFWFAVLPLCKQ